MTTRKLVDVPRGPNATAEAIEESGLVNIQSTGVVAVSECSYKYAIIGYEPGDAMTLSIELTDKEYVGIMRALGRVASDWSSYDSGIDSLELLHLRTLLAEAAAPDRKATA